MLKHLTQLLKAVKVNFNRFLACVNVKKMFILLRKQNTKQHVFNSKTNTQRRKALLSN